MKKRLLILLITILGLISCKDSGSPQSITELFLISINKLDFETANYLGTKNTRDLLKILKAVTDGKFSQEALEKRAENFKVDIIDIEMTSDTTAVVTFKSNPKILPFENLNLIYITEKLDKKSWKVDLSTLNALTKMNENKEMGINPDGSINTGQFHPDADSVAAEE